MLFSIFFSLLYQSHQNLSFYKFTFPSAKFSSNPNTSSFGIKSTFYSFYCHFGARNSMYIARSPIFLCFAFFYVTFFKLCKPILNTNGTFYIFSSKCVSLYPSASCIRQHLGHQNPLFRFFIIYFFLCLHHKTACFSSQPIWVFCFLLHLFFLTSTLLFMFAICVQLCFLFYTNHKHHFFL